MKLPFAMRSLSLVSVFALCAGSAFAQDDGAAERAAAVEEALAAFEALAESGAVDDDAAEAAADAERAAAVTEAREAFEALAAASLETAIQDAEAEAAAEQAEAQAAAERDAAVGEAQDAFAALAAEAAARVEAEAAAAREAAVGEAQDAFATLAAETAARVEAEAAAAREAAVGEAQDAFAELAAETAARVEAEAAAAREAAVGEAQNAFAALAAETAARAEAEAAAEREAAVEAAQSAFAALAAEQAAEAERQAAIAEAQSAFEVLAAESAARAEALAALDTCIATAGEPSAENFPSEEAQTAALNALREGFAACRAAVDGLPDDEAAPAIFHMATAAQSSGRHRRAVPLYERAAENGVAAAMTRLGDYHNFGLRPVREDAAQAVEFYRQASELGDPAGTATLAFMYRLGRGVEQSGSNYLRLMEDAATSGYSFARQNLAQTYLTGEGVPRGEFEGLSLPNPRAAVPLLVELANEGNVEAVQSLIELYSDGAGDVAPSDFLRGGWVDTLAQTGDPIGIAERGFLYEQGIGRPANADLAAADYVAALETGEVDIDTMRGTINGQTPPWDRDTAIAFQTILAERGLYTLRIDGDVGPGTRRAADGLSQEE